MVLISESISVTTTATVYANNLYTISGNSGAGRFMWAPTLQTTRVRQGSGPTLTTSYNVFSYEFEEVNDFGGDDSLRVLFGYALKKRTTETRNPSDTTVTLMKGRSEYLNLPMLTATVTRIDSLYNEESSRLATAAARRSGQQKTVLVFDVTSRTAEPMNIPPLYGLLEKSYAIDPPTGDIIAGTENEYETGFTATTSPVAPRGALLKNYRIGFNGRSMKTGEIKYAGGWYRNVPRSGLNVFGAKSSAFLDYADAPSLSGNTNKYPTGTKVYNTNSTATETLYDVHHLFETPVAVEQYVRYWNPVTSLEETRTLSAYTQRTFHGQVASSVDANGWYSAAEYDLNGRSKFVRLPFDFPEPSSCVEAREEKIFERATAMVQRTDTLDCDSLITRVGHEAAPVVTPHRLFAGHLVQVPDSCAEPHGKPFATQQYTGTLIYTAGSSDVVHSASSVTEAVLRLKPTAVSRDGCATLRVDLREFGYSAYYTFSCPSLDSLHPDSTTVTEPLNVDLMPVWSSLHSMASATKLHIDISMETPGAWVEFATYADDVLPALVINGTFSNCTKNDFTYAFRYDDLDLEARTFAKVDDNLHTTTPSWAQTWGDHDGRYSGSKDIFRSDGGVVETQLMIGHPDSPTQVDAAEFSLSGYGMPLSATNPLGDVVSAEYDDLGRVTEVTNTDNTTVTAAYDFNTPAYYGLTGQEFYGVCSRTITTDETSKQSVEYRDVFGRVLRTVADYGVGGGHLNATTKYNYDDWGRLKEVIAPNGVTTEYFYDDFHRLKRTEHPDAGIVSYSYDDAGNVRFMQTQKQADNDELLFTEYDDLGRPVVIGEAQLKHLEGEDIQGGDAGIGRWTEFLDPNILYNGNSGEKPLVTVNPTLWEKPDVSAPEIWDGGTLSSSDCLPEASEELQEETTPVGPYMVHPAVYYEATAIADAEDRAFENIAAYPEHVLTAMHYDELPRVEGTVWEHIPAASVWDDLTPKGEVRNLKGRPAATAYREHNGEPFHYVVTSYDERGRVEAFLRYTENLGYDAVYYTYNSANQVLSVRVCDPLRQYATWYGYDANGRMNKMWTLLGANGTGLGTGTPSYPTPLTKPNQEDMQYTYDQMGRVEQMRYLPEDILTRYRYNERSWLDSMFAIDASSPSDTVFKQRLSRDARGHITGQRSLQMGQTARVESYVYDGLDQLVEWSRGGSTVNYSYDIVGNRTSDNEPGTSRSYTFGDMTRPNKLTAMTAGTKTTSYSYDANGAMTEKLLTDGMATLLHHKLTYTQGGLVRQFEEILSTPGSITCVAAGTTLDASKRDWRYRYSATGEREQKRLYYSPHGDACGETHAWTYYLLGAGDEQLAVYNGRQTNEEDECENTGRRVHIYAVEYISPGGVASVVTRPDGTKELNLRDHLGSVRTVVKAGLTLAQYDYKPFGKVDWSVGGTKREGYIGKEEDRESLLGDYGVRKYDADIGRFLSVDKLFQQQPGYSPYHYSYNDPVNASDPSGLSILTQKVSSTFYVDDEGTRWRLDEGIPDATNTAWFKRSVYDGGNWLSDRDAAFMSLVANYVTQPNQAGQKGMGGRGSDNPTTSWETNLLGFSASTFRGMSLDDKVGLIRSFYDFSAITMTSLADGYEYGAILFAHGGIQHVIHEGGDITFTYNAAFQPLLMFHTHPHGDYNNAMFSGADVLSFAKYSGSGGISILSAGDQMYVLEMKDMQKAREFANKFDPPGSDNYGKDFNRKYISAMGNPSTYTTAGLERGMITMLMNSGIALYKKTLKGLQKIE